MTTRREIEQALAGKSSNDLNDFFDSLGFYKVNPGGATNEEKRREGILKYNLDLADKKRDRFTKICRGLDVPTPEEKLLEIEDARRSSESNKAERTGWRQWLRDHWLTAIFIPLAITLIGGLILTLL